MMKILKIKLGIVFTLTIWSIFPCSFAYTEDWERIEAVRQEVENQGIADYLVIFQNYNNFLNPPNNTVAANSVINSLNASVVITNPGGIGSSLM